MATVEQPTSAELKQEANEYLQRAANLERNKQYDEASVLYRRVISLIQTHEGASTVDNELSSIKRNANQLLLQSALHKNQSSNSTNTYQHMVRELSTHISQTTNQSDLSEQVFEDPTAFQPVTNESNAIVLFQLDTGAKLFYLAKDGAIQTPSETLPLTIFQVNEDNETCGLLKLGTWIYPLHPKVSPAFKTGYDAYIFPNNTSVGEFVGLMFDETISPEIRHTFEDILSTYTVFMAQQGTPTYGEALIPDKNKSEIIGRDEAIAETETPYDKTTKTGKLAASLITGTRFLTKQLATGVVMAENLIGKASKNVQGRIVPNSEPMKVNRGVHATVRGIRATSNVTVKASSYVVSKIGDMTLGLARTFAPTFGKVEKKVLEDGTVTTTKLSGLRGIGHAGITSFGIIYESSENAAKHLATNLANETIGVVKYKYGEDASVLTENAAYALGNAALTAHYVSGIGPKAIASKVVKQTAKETAKNAFL